MCGRFSLTKESEHVARLFELDPPPRLVPRYNIAPGQPVGAVVQSHDTLQRQWQLLQWGLIPSWAKDPAIGNRMINARSESVATKPAFRNALRYRRCLIAADGFYEWKQEGPYKQPHHIRAPQGELFAFAGLWEHWQDAHGNEIASCAILTRAANDAMRPIHDRMPFIVEPEKHGPWLDPKQQEVQAVTSLLESQRPITLTAQPVSTFVNDVRNEGPRCVRPCFPEGLFEG